MSRLLGIRRNTAAWSDDARSASIDFDHVSKVYPDGTLAVADLTLTVDEGELLVFVGPSGCGKTTALRMVAGLEEISTGAIRIGATVVNDRPSRERDIAMVFQSYALYPHLTTYENLAFSLRVQKVARDEVDKRVRAVARTLQLEDELSKKPRQLSGGQRQRVAMGRAIVRAPKAFLMDEPLSNLDAKLRVQMRAEIARLQRDLGVTTIYVTHDQVEAMTMGRRVAVMRRAELQQVAEPQELYDRPVNLFVAGFIGSPAMNFFHATVKESQEGLVAQLGATEIFLPQRVIASRPDLFAYIGRQVVVGVRPEDLLEVSAPSVTDASCRIGGTVILREGLGSEVIAHVVVAAKPVVTEETRELARDIGGETANGSGIETRDAESTIIARLEARTRIKDGDRVELAINATDMHFFDAESGAGIYDRLS